MGTGSKRIQEECASLDKLISQARQWALLFVLQQSMPREQNKTQIKKIVLENSYLQELLLHRCAEDVASELLRGKKEKLEVYIRKEKESRIFLTTAKDKTKIAQAPITSDLSDLQDRIRNILGNYLQYPFVLIGVAKERTLEKHETDLADHYRKKVISLVKQAFEKS